MKNSATLLPLLVYAIFTAPLCLPEGHNVGYLMLVIWGMVAIFRQPLTPSRSLQLYALSLGLYCLIQIVSHYYFQAAFRHYEKPLKFLLILPALLAVMPQRIDSRHLLYAAMLGSAGAGVVALADLWLFGLTRAEGWHNSIDFGGVAIVLCSIILAGCRSCADHYPLLLLAQCCAGMGMIACLSTGSRGPWLAIPIVVVVLLWQNRMSLKDWLFQPQRYVASYLILGITIGAGLWPVQHRLEETDAELAEIREGDNTSAGGVRIEMWKNAWFTYWNSPLFGVGQQQAMDLTKEHIQRGLVHPAIAEFNVAHSQYLDQLVRFGLPGFLSLLAILVVPIWIFIQRARTFVEVEFPALSGVFLVSILAVCMLTQSSLAVNMMVNLYLAGTVILLHLSKPDDPQQKPETSLQDVTGFATLGHETN